MKSLLKIYSYFGFVIALTVAQSEVEEKFISSKIVPDVLNNPPEAPCVVNYTGRVVKIGETLEISKTLMEPSVQFDFDPQEFYTIAFVDPDAPSPNAPAMREFKHWLVVNVQSSSKGAPVQGSSGDTLAAYMSPAPLSPAPHRYIVLVYRQPGRLEFDEPIIVKTAGSSAPRTNFKVQKFAEKYNLTGPVCGSFFYEQMNKVISL
ncbi:protein D2 [Plutella xylostella]|uniref:protein D2 n=1 Tax=Plutella xylostella TaxID=51655 RepID=UPI002032C954|nr:protein D2 [Plutella xylostella]